MRTNSRSASSSVSTAVRTIRRFKRCSGLWRPGVSRRAIWAPGAWTTPRILVLVVCGFSETIAIFSFNRRFSNVDFPTLDRPIMATVPNFIVSRPRPLLGGFRNQLVHGFALADIAEPFAGQLLDRGRIVLQSIDVSAQRLRRPLEFLDVQFKLLGMVTHRKIARQAHLAETQGEQKQQAGPGADVMRARDHAPLPVQPLPSAILLDDHALPAKLLIAGPASPHGRGISPPDPVPLRSGATDCTSPPDPSGTAI